MKAMLLAAGRGIRLRPLSDSIPKPLLSVGGMPLIVRHIRRLTDAGLNDIVINVSHLGGKIISALGDGNRYGARIRYSIEPNPLEVGGGIIRALPLLGDDSFLAVNADIFCDCDFSRFYPPPPLPFGESVFAHLMLVPNPPHNSAGDFMLGDDGKILPPPPLFSKRFKCDIDLFRNRDLSSAIFRRCEAAKKFGIEIAAASFARNFRRTSDRRKIQRRMA